MKDRKRSNTIRGNTKPTRNRCLSLAQQSVSFESLENRQLMAVINVADFGANPNDGQDDRSAIQNAIDSSAQGDTVQFAAGRYDLGEELQVGTGRTLKGAGNLGTHLQFNIGENDWGFRIMDNAQNVTIDGFRIVGGGITLENGDGYRNITIKNNDISAVAEETYNGNGPAIFQAQDSDGLVIENNNIHDLDGYAFIGFSFNNLRFANNTITNVYQGAHILSPHNDNYIGGNKLSGLVRMGFEVQSHGGSVSRNLLVENNVITNWRRVFNDSFALSIVPDGGYNTRVINNYLKMHGPGYNGPWERPNDPESHRGGYGIEYGAHTGEVSGNVIGGIFANYIIISGGGGSHTGPVRVENNRMYGVPEWTDYITTEANAHDGLFTESNNLESRNYSEMPPPPQGTPVPTPTPTPTPTPNPTPNPDPVPNPNPVPEPDPGPLPNPTPTQYPAPTNVRARNATPTSIALTWRDNARDEVQYLVQRKNTGGTDDWATVAELAAGTRSYTDQALTRTWAYDYRIIAVGPNGEQGISGTVSAKSGTVGSPPPIGDPVPIPVPTPQGADPKPIERFVGYPLSDRQIRMIWKDTNRNETGYRVERSLAGANQWTAVRTLPAGSKVFVDKKLKVNTTYDYRVVTINPRGEAISGIMTATTMAQSPSVGSHFVHLNTMKWLTAKGDVRVNADAEGGSLALGQQGYFRGLGVKADSELKYLLDGKYRTFTTDFGLDDAGRKGSVVFQIFADGHKLFDSGVVKGIGPARTVTVPVNGAMELWLVVSNAEDDTAYDFANWANPRLAA